MIKESRRIRREKERELEKIKEDVNRYYSEFYFNLFNAPSFISYNEIFNSTKERFKDYAIWANKYKYKFLQIDTNQFHNEFKSIV